VRTEPVEDVYIEVGGDFLGAVMEMLGTRRSQMKEMHTADDGSVHLRYLVPTRGAARVPQQIPYGDTRHRHHSRSLPRVRAHDGRYRDT